MKIWIGLICTGLLVALVGCGGGGGGSGGTTGGVTPQPALAPNTGTITVRVTDALGQPASGAQVTLDSITYRYADDDGVVQYSSFPAGLVYAVAQDLNAPVGGGGIFEGQLEPGGHLDIALATQPWNDTSVVGIDKAQVATDGVSEDGRSLEFSLRFMYPGFSGDPLQGDVHVAACTPDSGNDEPAFQADCVQGPPEFDAPYQAGNSGLPLEIATLPPATPSPYAVAILLDQGSDLVATDPADARLFMLKYYLLRKPEESAVVIAAYGANDSASGEISTLPLQPLTIYPLDDPQFTAAGASLLPAVDSLTFSEGGTSPLLASLSKIVEFGAVHAPPNSSRAVVVLSGGRDTTCGTARQCTRAQEALIDQIQASQTRLFTVGITHFLPEGFGELSDGRALSQLAAEAGGIALWGELADVFQQLPALLDGSAQYNIARFRLESSVEGTFRSGQTVLATLYVTESAWFVGTVAMRIPFEIRIP